MRRNGCDRSSALGTPLSVAGGEFQREERVITNKILKEIECKTHVPFLCVVCMTKTEVLMRSRFLIILSGSYKTLIGTAYIMLCNISLALYENYN